MQKKRFVSASLALLGIGLLTVGACVCLAQGPPEVVRPAPMALKAHKAPPASAVSVMSPRTNEQTAETLRLTREQRRAKLQMELETIKLDEQIQELNRQKQRLHDQQRSEQVQRQIELTKLDEKIQEINHGKKLLSSEHRLQDQKIQNSQMELDAKIRELNRQKQEMQSKLRRKHIENQLQSLDAEALPQQ